MKTLSCSIALIIAFTLAAPALASGTKEYQKEIHKEFSISSDGEVEINNKYGHIDVIPGSGNSVIIDVIIVSKKYNDSVFSLEKSYEKNINNHDSLSSWWLFRHCQSPLNTGKSRSGNLALSRIFFLLI